MQGDAKRKIYESELWIHDSSCDKSLFMDQHSRSQIMLGHPIIWAKISRCSRPRTINQGIPLGMGHFGMEKTWRHGNNDIGLPPISHKTQDNIRTIQVLEVSHSPSEFGVKILNWLVSLQKLIFPFFFRFVDIHVGRPQKKTMFFDACCYRLGTLQG